MYNSILFRDRIEIHMDGFVLSYAYEGDNATCSNPFNFQNIDINHISRRRRQRTGVIGSNVPWLDCPACNALTWVITVTE